MDMDLMNRISTLNFHGYYDPSKNMVAVHFYDQQYLKLDLIAFLNRDLSWDLREIVSESSQLTNDGEIINVKHNLVSILPKDSDFDKFVRVGLESMAKEIHGKDVDLEQKDKIFSILNKGYKEDN